MQRDAYYKNYNLYIFFPLYYGTVGLIFFLQTSGTKKFLKKMLLKFLDFLKHFSQVTVLV